MRGKVALVTGSTSGIGLGIAEKLAKKGCDIVLNGFGDLKDIETLKQKLSAEHKVRVSYNNADLGDLQACQALVPAIQKEMGRLDILVNNAGIQHVAPVESCDIEQWQRVLFINLTAPFCLIKAALPLMRAQGWGRIINIASAHGLVASAGKSPYVSAKHGLLGLTKTVALETATSHITCNAICPGWVYTPLVANQITERAKASGRTIEEEKKALLMEKQPSGEFATPEQIGGFVAFLCTEDAAQIRGATLSIDGGWTIQ